MKFLINLLDKLKRKKEFSKEPINKHFLIVYTKNDDPLIKHYWECSEVNEKCAEYSFWEAHNYYTTDIISIQEDPTYLD